MMIKLHHRNMYEISHDIDGKVIFSILIWHHYKSSIYVALCPKSNKFNDLLEMSWAKHYENPP